MFSPSLARCALRNSLTLTFAQRCCTGGAALAAKLGGGFVLSFVAGVKFLFALPGRNLHDANGIADHVSGSLFGASLLAMSATRNWRIS